MRLRSACALACHFGGLWDTLVHTGNTIHGNIGVRAHTLLVVAVWTYLATLQLVGMCSASWAIQGHKTWTGRCPWAKSGHAGTGHCRGRRAESFYYTVWAFQWAVVSSPPTHTHIQRWFLLIKWDFRKVIWINFLLIAISEHCLDLYKIQLVN